jgi:two-component system response regulator FlrC
MDVRLQAKLLRAIQERVIDRVGGTRPVPVEHPHPGDLEPGSGRERARLAQFREDLLFRLNVVNLKLPPLAGAAGRYPGAGAVLHGALLAKNGVPVRAAL